MKRRRKESGFAMLLVFLMAACVAITLYIEIPRVAFEAERQREMLLVDRGNQFKRAIQVFVTDKTNNPTHRYPASLDELESFNGHRYLRHRYVDPMTGKDEWRLVHINGGILTDSVATQTMGPNGQPIGPGQPGATQAGGTSAANTPEFISSTAFMDSSGNGTANGGVTRALNRRPSDTTGAPGTTPDPNNPGALPPQNTQGGLNASNNGLPPMPGSPGALPPGMPVLPGVPGQQGIPGQMPGMPAGVLPGQMPGMPNNTQQQAPSSGSCFIGDCGTSTSGAANPQAGQIPPQGGGMVGGTPQGGASGFGATPGGPGGSALSQQQSAAASMIGNLLTTPRPGGMPTGMPGATIGGGIAGVASKYEAEGIMVINQRTKINEWEYIFDQTKYRAPPNPLTGPATTPLPGMAPNGGTPIGTPLGPGQTTTTGTGPGTTPGPGGGGQGQ